MRKSKSIRVTPQSIERASKGIKEKSLKVTDRTMEKIAKVTSELAQYSYMYESKYDGDPSDAYVTYKQRTVGSYTITAHGESAMFIELGTGAKANSAYINPKTGKPYWWFSATAGTRRGAGGAFATYKRLTPESKEERQQARLEKTDAVGDAKYIFRGKEYNWSQLFQDVGDGRISYFGFKSPMDFENAWRKNIVSTTTGIPFRDWAMQAVISKSQVVDGNSKSNMPEPIYEEVTSETSIITSGNVAQPILKDSLKRAVEYVLKK